MKNKTSEKITLHSGKAYLGYTLPSEEEEKDIELKPCPFCGGKAKLKEDTQCGGHGMFIKEYFVKCMQCGGKSRTSAVYGIPEDVAKATAIDAWNTRGGKR